MMGEETQLGALARGCGVEKGVVVAESDCFLVVVDDGLPPLRSFEPVHAPDTARGSLLRRRVFTLLLDRRGTQIQPPIISTRTVAVIDFMLRPFAGHIEHSEAMRVVVHAFVADQDVTR